MGKFDNLINNTFAALMQEQQQPQQQVDVNNPQIALMNAAAELDAKENRGEKLNADELALKREAETQRRKSATDAKRKLQNMRDQEKMEKDAGL